MSAKIIEFRRRSRQRKATASKLIRANVNDYVFRRIEMELAEFADNLSIARGMVRDYPELITAPDFPEHLIQPFKNQCGGGDPRDVGNFSKPTVSAYQIRQFRREAKAIFEGRSANAV